MKKVSDSKITSLGLTDEPHKLVTTDHVGSTSVVRPVAGFDNYTAIQAYVHTQLPDGYLLKEHATVTVLGATATSAATTAELLKNYGYNVTATGTTTGVSGPLVVDLSHGKDPYTRHYLETRYGVKALSSLPAGVTLADGSTNFVIIGR
jgi:hypothetical protein